MNRREQLQYLNQILLTEMPQYREQAEAFPSDDISQRRLLRSLMNVRPPAAASAQFLAVQDAYLQERLAKVYGTMRYPVKESFELKRRERTQWVEDAAIERMYAIRDALRREHPGRR